MKFFPDPLLTNDSANMMRKTSCNLRCRWLNSDALRAPKKNQNDLLTCKSLIKIMEKTMPRHKIKRFRRTGCSKNVDANSEKSILITMVSHGYKWAKYT